MKKQYKYVNRLKKLDDILKYSSVDQGMTKKELKQYEKSNKTLILDKKTYSGYRNGRNYRDLKTLIIEEDIIKNNIIEINECTAENIYIKNHSNTGGISIPYEFFINNKCTLKLIWDKEERTKIEVINIFMNDSVIPIESKLIEEITITTKDDTLLIKLENYNSIIMYKVNPLCNNSLGKVEKEYMARELLEEDIKNGILDLRKYNEFETLYFKKLKFNKLVMNKDNIKNIYKYINIFANLDFKTLNITDDYEMKLFPSVISIELDEKENLTKCYSKYYGNYIRIETGEKAKIVYIDASDNIIFINKKYLEKKYNIKNAKVIYEKAYSEATDFMLLIEDNNNKFKVIMNDKEYMITNAFKNFLLLNKDIYIPDRLLENIENDDWFNVIGYSCFNCKSFMTKYKDYLEYKERLNKLKKIGLSYNALKYLHDKNMNSIINTQTEEGLIDIKDISDYEVEAFNKIGEEYVKRLKR